MTITHKTVQAEAEALKSIIDSGDVCIPGFWDCAWPGFLLILWLTIWPAIVFGLFTAPSEGTLIAIGFSVFFGFLINFGIFNARSMYLALPLSFRQSSKIIAMIKKKAIAYLFVFLAFNVVAGLLSDNDKGGALQYLFPTIVTFCILGFIFSSDIGRYRLSAFTSAMELLKSRKQGGE